MHLSCRPALARHVVKLFSRPPSWSTGVSGGRTGPPQASDTAGVGAHWPTSTARPGRMHHKRLWEFKSPQGPAVGGTVCGPRVPHVEVRRPTGERSDDRPPPPGPNRAFASGGATGNRCGRERVGGNGKRDRRDAGSRTFSRRGEREMTCCHFVTTPAGHSRRAHRPRRTARRPLRRSAHRAALALGARPSVHRPVPAAAVRAKRVGCGASQRLPRRGRC
jgi:hypothetical protein